MLLLLTVGENSTVFSASFQHNLRYPFLAPGRTERIWVLLGRVKLTQIDFMIIAIKHKHKDCSKVSKTHFQQKSYVHQLCAL